jgi:hypothetical protein
MRGLSLVLLEESLLFQVISSTKFINLDVTFTIFNVTDLVNILSIHEGVVIDLSYLSKDILIF